MDSNNVERRLLGTILLSPNVLSQADYLTEQDLGLQAHQLVIRAMRALSESGQRVDELSVSGELEQRGQLAKAGGRAYLTDPNRWRG